MPDETEIPTILAVPTAPSNLQPGLEEEAQAYLEEQEKSLREAYNASTISIVVSLLPADAHPQGRLVLLSVKNDNDAPLFGAPVREDEVLTLLETPGLAELLQNLKALLPQRLKEREEKEKAKALPVSGSGAGAVAVASRTTPARGGKKSASETELRSRTGGTNLSSDGQATDDLTDDVASTSAHSLSQSSIAPGKTTQLTLF